MPTYLLCTVQIKQAVFEEYLQIANRSDIDRRFFATNFLYSPMTLLTVRTYLKQLQYLAWHQPHLLKRPYLKKLILEDFIPLLVDRIPLREKVTQPLSTLSRVPIVKQAEDYMMANLERPLTLKDICETLHVSRRPLFYDVSSTEEKNHFCSAKIKSSHEDFKRSPLKSDRLK